jgi:ribosomal protein L11 methyltransferase
MNHLNHECFDEGSYWLLITVRVVRELEEDISALLFEHGSTGIETLAEDSDAITLGAYFSSIAVAEEIKQAIESECLRINRPEALSGFSSSLVPNQDWMQKWKEGFEPIEIGSRLIIAPSWKLPARNENRLVVQIDPGMAFGTGTHETTRLCLEAIERYWDRGSLLDVGTGTGILAIAVALLSPDSRVVAIDIDPQAVVVAAENTEINDVTNRIELLTGQPGDLDGQRFSIVVANLTAEVIVDLMPDLAKRVDAEGLMILSGILRELAESVQQSLSSFGFRVVERKDLGEWCALVAAKTN